MHAWGSTVMWGVWGHAGKRSWPRKLARGRRLPQRTQVAGTAWELIKALCNLTHLCCTAICLAFALQRSCTAALGPTKELERLDTAALVTESHVLAIFYDLLSALMLRAYVAPLVVGLAALQAFAAAAYAAHRKAI